MRLLFCKWIDAVSFWADVEFNGAEPFLSILSDVLLVVFLLFISTFKIMKWNLYDNTDFVEFYGTIHFCPLKLYKWIREKKNAWMISTAGLTFAHHNEVAYLKFCWITAFDKIHFEWTIWISISVADNFDTLETRCNLLFTDWKSDFRLTNYFFHLNK